jgi:predicted lysophospholipase L1 biosynthesis ABC-type transport system permease subunit
MEPIEQTTHLPPAGQHRASYADPAVWMRGLYMVLLALAFSVAHALLVVTAIAQFLWLLFAGEANAQIAQFGRSLSKWLADTGRFLTGASEAKPFPWAPWPAAE